MGGVAVGGAGGNYGGFTSPNIESMRNTFYMDFNALKAQILGTPVVIWAEFDTPARSLLGGHFPLVDLDGIRNPYDF